MGLSGGRAQSLPLVQVPFGIHVFLALLPGLDSFAVLVQGLGAG